MAEAAPIGAARGESRAGTMRRRDSAVMEKRWSFWYRSRIATDRAARMRDGSARHGRDESRDPSSGRRGGQKRCLTFN